MMETAVKQKCSWFQRKRRGGNSKEEERNSQVFSSFSPRSPPFPCPGGLPLTHHEHNQKKVTDLLQYPWAQDQQQPRQQFQPAHSHLIGHGIWLVAEHLQREHLSELDEQSFLGEAGNACQPLTKDPWLRCSTRAFGACTLNSRSGLRSAWKRASFPREPSFKIRQQALCSKENGWMMTQRWTDVLTGLSLDYNPAPNSRTRKQGLGCLIYCQGLGNSTASLSYCLDCFLFWDYVRNIFGVREDGRQTAAY